MASPFAVFRRNQKIMLAIVGIGAMVAFVFLDPVMRYMGRSGAPENPVVVETKYGPLKESDLAAMRQSRELVEIFLQRVAAETIGTQVKNGVIDPRMADRAVQQWYGTWHQNLMGRSTMAPEEAAVETLVLAKKAQQLGIVVSDRAVNEFLKQVSADTLNSETMQSIVNSLQMGRRVSAARLFDAIRTEMLASRFAELFAQSLRDIPPAQKFEYYCRLNRRAKIEFAPLAVADFISQVPDPSSEELQTFFDKYKDQFANPASPEPGFKEPKRATFQYFKADFAKFSDQLKPQVTDEEIAAYYEKNKEQFRALELPNKEGEKEDEADDSMPAEGEESQKPDDAKSSEPAPEDADNPPAPPSAEKAPNSDESKAEKPADDKSSTAERASRMRLVSVLADEPKADTGPAIEAPQANAPEGAQDDAAKLAPAPDAEKTEPQDKPADESADNKPADENAEQPAADADKPIQEAEQKPEPPKYEPLEKVRDQIRDSIAGQKASEKIGAIFEELSAEMKRYADDLDLYNARKESDGRAVAPKPFPFAELAKSKDIEARELVNVTAAEAAQEDVGQLRKFVQDRRSQFGFRADPFTQFAFSDSWPTYKTEILTDNQGNGFLIWKTEEKAAYVPTLDEVRDKVVRAWKMIKARELARKRADEYAAQARTSNKTLAEAFANQSNLKVTDTDLFSWMTLGSVPFDPSGGQPRLSQVEGVEHVGDAFMEDVFGSGPHAISVTTNEPLDTVYVVRLVEFEKPLDDLQQTFASENQRTYMAVAAPAQRRIYMSWLDNVEKDAGVKWLRQADIAARRNLPVEAEPMDEGDF